MDGWDHGHDDIPKDGLEHPVLGPEIIMEGGAVHPRFGGYVAHAGLGKTFLCKKALCSLYYPVFLVNVFCHGYI